MVGLYSFKERVTTRIQKTSMLINLDEVSCWSLHLIVGGIRELSSISISMEYKVAVGSRRRLIQAPSITRSVFSLAASDLGM